MAEIMNDINKLRAECEVENAAQEMVCNDPFCRSKLCCEGDRLSVMFLRPPPSWRPYEPSREAEREGTEASPRSP